MEASVAPQGVLLGEIVDLDVENLPLDEPPAEEGDDAAAHEATNGAVDEQQALREEAAEQEALDPDEVPDDEADDAAAVGVNIKKLRIRIVRAAMLGHKHAAKVHYTMGARRWDGIANRCRAHLGRFPRFADCSSYVTWCLWDALGGPNAGPDVVNGQFWKGGFTGTMKHNGRRVPGGLANALPGDLVLYGPGTGKHVTIVVAKNKVISHGSEGGPFLVKPDYRSDIAEVRRYIG
jgi:cell wall-associated NlpC family hydrolase